MFTALFELVQADSSDPTCVFTADLGAQQFKTVERVFRLIDTLYHCELQN